MSFSKSTNSPQDNILSCPICMDIYKVPRMLPCQHTLCETCLHSYIVNKSRERVLVSDFPCPVCRASTPAPRAFTRIDTWSSLFPLNHLLVSLLDSSFQEILERTDSTASLPGDKCSEHSGKMIEFFCLGHNTKLCSKCFKNGHRQCDILDIEEHVEFTSRYDTIKSDVENLLGYLTDAISHLKANIEQLCTQKNAILTEVREFRGKVESLLNSIETDIKDQVNVQHDGEVVVLKAHCEKYERIKAEIDASEKTLAELPVTGNITQSLEKISAVENELKNQLAFIHGSHSNIKLVKLEFTIENQLLSFLNSFGQIGNVSSNQFEASLPEPPVVVSQGSTLNESFVPSPRDTSMTAEDIQTSRSPIRHVSPRAILISRSQIPTLLGIDTGNQGTTESASTHRPVKEQKRPKTVPIESTAPTPVVRPRAERPEVRGIPHFLPRSCSSPLGHAAAFNTIEAATPDYDKTPVHDVSNDEEHPSGKSTGDRHGGHESGFTPIGNSAGNSSDAAATSKPPVCEKPKHRAWQYVNILSGVGDICSRRNSESGDAPAVDAGPIKSLFRHRSSSASNATEDAKPTTCTTSVNQMIRSFQNRVSVNVDTSQANNPVYENALLTSVASTPTSERSFTFNAPAVASTLRGNPNSRFCTRMKDIVTRIDSDPRECTITGSVELPDKRLILVDCNNSKLKLFNQEVQCVCHLDLAKEPWNVAAMSGTEIAVTVPLEKTIHVIRVSTSSMTTQRCVVTRRECWGIAYLDRKFIITTKEDGNQVAFLDENGRELQIVNFASRENPNILRPVSVSTSNHENVLYVCCEGQSGTKGSVVRMSTRGDVLYVFTHKELDRPYSAAVDQNNDVYVTAIRSSNVLMLSEGGASVTSILSRDLGLSRPQHIHVTTWEDKTVLILTERRSDRASVYCMKK